MLMRTRTSIDFHAVEEKHFPIHERLLNWARWCNGSGSPATSPMFRLFVASARAKSGDGVAFSSSGSVDTHDAHLIAKAVSMLPDPHRAAVNWCYIKPTSPRRAASSIGTTLEGLALLLRDGRQMLVNRKA
jgi:hypothetical protein